MENTQVTEVLGKDNLQASFYAIGKVVDTSDLVLEDYTDNKGATAKRIRGKFTVKSNEDELTIKVFATQFTNSGAENKSFKSLVALVNGEYTTIAQGGEEGATRIRVSGSIQEGKPYKTQSGEVVCAIEYRGSFVSATKAESIEDEIAGSSDMYIQGYIKETKLVDEEVEETGRLIINALAVSFGGKVFPYKLIVDDESAIDFFTDEVPVGSTLNVSFLIKHRAVKSEKPQEKKNGGWGRKISTSNSFTKFINEVIACGCEDLYSEDFNPNRILPKEQITKALAVRQEEIDAVENETPKTSTAKKGFGTTKATAPTPQPTATVSEDELPF